MQPVVAYHDEDIRLQLPDEAKKFDQIDKAFIQIMKATNQER